MTANLKKLAQKFVEGEWSYSANEKTLKKNFSNSKELAELNLVDDEGYLNENLKTAIEEILGEDVLNEAQGPFGDSDIFSGDIFDDITQYNLELHEISEKTMDALQKIPNVSIKIVA